jgi:hypothetical protein
MVDITCLPFVTMQLLDNQPKLSIPTITTCYKSDGHYKVLKCYRFVTMCKFRFPSGHQACL